EVILILHDHKLRAGASLKERILIFLYRYHIRFFTKIIIHSNVNEEKNDKIVYLKMPFHYEERHVAKEKIKLLQFGRIDDYKNIKGLVNIIKNNENFELIIAGSGHLSKKEKLDIANSKNITLINQYINADISEL
ncbi:TPA: glycosyltransferase family 4 protein, partial [Escherichia coli]|nr:glycosyltransferase family 4 protein [Escherichia coli]